MTELHDLPEFVTLGSLLGLLDGSVLTLVIPIVLVTSCTIGFKVLNWLKVLQKPSRNECTILIKTLIRYQLDDYAS